MRVCKGIDYYERIRLLNELYVANDTEGLKEVIKEIIELLYDNTNE